MPSLCVTIIVKNEAACLPACLESVAPIADTIVIGDTGSTDGTQAIAQTFTDCVFDIPWCDDFAAARNAVLDQAKGDWILHMDADECLDPEGARAIRALVDRNGDGADAIELTLANYCDDARAWRWTPARRDDPFARGHAGYIAAPLLRLFRNGRGFEYREPVHENITVSVMERGGVIRPSDILIHHYGYTPNNPTKAARYLAILERKAREHPEDAKALHDLAEQLVSMDRPHDAEPYCRAVLDREPTHLAAATTLANIYLNRGALEEARSVLTPLDEDGIAPPHVLTALAAIDLRQGHVPNALARLDRALTHTPNHILARLYISRALDLLGQPEAAGEALELACGFAPGLAEPIARLQAHRTRRMADVLCAAGDARTALTHYVQALQQDPEDPLIHFGLHRVLRALGETSRADMERDRALLLAPSLRGVDAALENAE